MKFAIPALLLAHAAAAPGCGKDFDPENRVASVRVLATRVDKPYAAPGDTVSVEVLAFDGRKDKPAPMEVFWFPAPFINQMNDGYYACYPQLTSRYRTGVDISASLQRRFRVRGVASTADATA